MTAYRHSFLPKEISFGRKIVQKLDCTDVPLAPRQENLIGKLSSQGTLEACSLSHLGLNGSLLIDSLSTCLLGKGAGCQVHVKKQQLPQTAGGVLSLKC